MLSGVVFLNLRVIKTPVRHAAVAIGLFCIISGVLIVFVILFATGRIQNVFAMDNGGNIAAKEVIIDPGHGGLDGGAVGVGGVVEKGINLSISLKLKKFFEAAGYRVIMTRVDDRSIYSSGSDTVREKKTSDIHNRFHIMEQNPKAIFISIHQNKFEQSQYSGTQVFYSANNDDSKLLAGFIQTRVKTMLQSDNERVIKPAGNNLYLLYHAKSPAVLVECGFLSNPKEASLLQNSDYQNKMAYAVFCAALNYYSGAQTTKK